MGEGTENGLLASPFFALERNDLSMGFRSFGKNDTCTVYACMHSTKLERKNLIEMLVRKGMNLPRLS